VKKFWKLDLVGAHGIKTLAREFDKQGLVAGIDISDQICLVARKKIMKENLPDRLILVCGNAVFLPFKSGFFNAIFMSFTLELFDTQEIPVVLQECKRVINSKQTYIYCVPDKNNLSYNDD
jgi:ubiquinone/menaquinone biosynthesis C-methylase UbiE